VPSTCGSTCAASAGGSSSRRPRPRSGRSSRCAKSIFQKGKTEGKAEGTAAAYAETLVRLLTRWMGAFDEALQERLRHVTDPGILEPWLDEAVGLGDPKAAQRLAKKIRKGLPV
jgi:hypothetical protein